MIRLILIRHCETDLNKNKYLGSTDPPLDPTGKTHAKQIAKELKHQDLSKIYSSDLKRAYQTANLIAKSHSLKVETLQNLNEINFGSFEGLTFDEILARDKKNAEKYLTNPSAFRFPGGETQSELNKRVLKSLDTIVKKHINSNETILAVAHGGTNRVILGRALNITQKDQFRIKQDHGCVNIIDFFEDFAVVALMNYTINSNSKMLKEPENCVKTCEKCKKENCYSF